MSTLFVNNLNTASGSTITIPTGKKIIGTDNSTFVAPGMILQTVQTVSRTQVTENTTSYVEAHTNFRCSITPKFSNSKLLITATLGLNGYNNTGNDCNIHCKLYDVTNSADIANSETNIREIDYGGSGNSISAVPTCILLVDFQNANEHTITWYYKRSTSLYVLVNDDTKYTQIMLQEIAQ